MDKCQVKNMHLQASEGVNVDYKQRLHGDIIDVLTFEA